MTVRTVQRDKQDSKIYFPMTDSFFTRKSVVFDSMVLQPQLRVTILYFVKTKSRIFTSHVRQKKTARQCIALYIGRTVKHTVVAFVGHSFQRDIRGTFFVNQIKLMSILLNIFNKLISEISDQRLPSLFVIEDKTYDYFNVDVN